MLIVMLAFLAGGIPIVFAIGLASLTGMLVVGAGAPLIMIPNSMFNGMDSFPLMAVPFFVLAGEIMNRGGITVRLVRFANALVGRFTGGLAHANIVASMLFAGITGSALADTAAIGSTMIPAMRKAGYDADYSAAVTASSSLIGPIIPPSITMVIFGVTASVSIGGLFLSGIVPGILIGLGLMVMASIIARRRGYQMAGEAISPRKFVALTGNALLALMMPVIILGGIFGGIMTPTEAAAVAVAYSLLVGMLVFRELHLKDLPILFLRAGRVTAMIMIIVGVARIFADVLSSEQVPQQLSAAIMSLTDNKWLILLLMNLFLLLVGCVMDTTAAIIILTPVLLPVATSIGLDPLTFGIIMCINLIIGLATPPLGICLFVAADIANISFEKLVMAIWPFLLVEVAVLLLITYVPEVAMIVPRYFGYL
ncbi:MAG: TRAP transporter large permease [SAR324 cluster bacterium]|nr:TRAP transporter large permease [SAR324 cluster bacterium]